MVASDGLNTELLLLHAESGHIRYDDTGEEEVAGSKEGLVTIDGWLHLRIPLHHLPHICCLRHRLTQAFAAKVCLCSKGHW